MSLDGLSFANLGFYRPVDPAEVAHQAELTSEKQAKILMNKVNEIEKNELDPDGKNGNHQEGSLSEKENEEQLDEEFLQSSSNLSQYSVKFNNQTNLVELLDKTTGKIMETILPEDLINLMAKAKNVSGILVDREI